MPTTASWRVRGSRPRTYATAETTAATANSAATSRSRRRSPRADTHSSIAAIPATTPPKEILQLQHCLVDQRRDHALQRLRHDNTLHQFEAAHPERAAGVPLSCFDRRDPATDDLRI